MRLLCLSHNNFRVLCGQNYQCSIEIARLHCCDCIRFANIFAETFHKQQQSINLMSAIRKYCIRTFVKKIATGAAER